MWFVFDHDTALFAAIPGSEFRSERFKVAVPHATGFIALGAVPLHEFIRIDGQVTSAAAQALTLIRQQNQVLVAASGHVIDLFTVVELAGTAKSVSSS